MRLLSRPALLCLSLLASPVAAEEPPGFVLRWPQAVYAWYYNDAGRPADWLERDEALALVRDAAAGWSACGVELRYMGMSDNPAGRMDGTNVVGWSADGRKHSAWTAWRAHRDGRAIEADVTLYANVFDAYRRRGIDAKLELRKSIFHEFGHVLGLKHSPLPGDAMSTGIRTRPEWVLPSANDLEQCRQLHSPPPAKADLVPQPKALDSRV